MLNKLKKIKIKNLKQRIEIIKSKTINNYFDYRFKAVHNQIIDIEQEIESKEVLIKNIITDTYNHISKVKEIKDELIIKNLDKDLLDNRSILITFEDSFNRVIKLFIKTKEFKNISKINQFNNQLDIIKNSFKIKEKYVEDTVKKIANNNGYKKIAKTLNKNLEKINNIKKILEFKKKDLEQVKNRLERLVENASSNSIIYNIQNQMKILNDQKNNLIKTIEVAGFYEFIGGSV